MPKHIALVLIFTIVYGLLPLINVARLRPVAVRFVRRRTFNDPS